jgi:hypothetical protein
MLTPWCAQEDLVWKIVWVGSGRRIVAHLAPCALASPAAPGVIFACVCRTRHRGQPLTQAYPAAKDDNLDQVLDEVDVPPDVGINKV